MTDVKKKITAILESMSGWRSIEDCTNDLQLFDAVMQIMHDGGDLAELRWDAKRSMGIEDVMGADTPAIRKRVEAFVKDTVEERIGQVAIDLENLFNSGSLTVYRMISAPPNWRYDPTKHPGIYWAWDRKGAEPYHGTFTDGEVKWLFTAEITEDMVDWWSTIIQNVSLYYQGEHEIRLMENSSIPHNIRVERV